MTDNKPSLVALNNHLRLYTQGCMIQRAETAFTEIEVRDGWLYYIEIRSEAGCVLLSVADLHVCEDETAEGKCGSFAENASGRWIDSFA